MASIQANMEELGLKGRVARLRLFFEYTSRTGDFNKTLENFDDCTAEPRRPNCEPPNRLWEDESFGTLSKNVMASNGVEVSAAIGKVHSNGLNGSLLKNQKDAIDVELNANIPKTAAMVQTVSNDLMRNSAIVSSPAFETNRLISVHNDDINLVRHAALIAIPQEKLSSKQVMDNVQPLFTASVIYPFKAETGKMEVGAEQGEVVEVYEVAENGWCLAKIGDRIGWIPQSFLQILQTRGDIDQALLLALPSQQERDAVVRFLRDSNLFSEALLIKKVPVYTDDIDRIIRVSKSTAGALAALGELDSHLKKFDAIEELPDSIAELTERWENIADEAQTMLNENKALFNGSIDEISKLDTLRILTESTCGSDLVFRLWAEIEAPTTRHDGLDSITSALAKRQHQYLEEKYARIKLQRERVFEALRRPDVNVFERMLDLRANPVDQVLENGVDSDAIIDRLEKFSSAQRRFPTLEAMMTAVFEAESAADSSVLCMGRGTNFSALSNPDQDVEEEEIRLAAMSPEQRLQAMSSAVMAELTLPSMQLFSQMDSHVRVTRESLGALLESSSSLRTLLCNIRILNAAAVRLSCFEDLLKRQDDPIIEREKQEVGAALQRFLNNRVMPKPSDIERLLNRSGGFAGKARFLLDEDDVLVHQKPFDSLKTLADAIARRCSAIESLRPAAENELLEWFGTHALFTQEVDMFQSNIDTLFRIAITGERLISALHAFEVEDECFDDFEALVAALKTRLEKADDSLP